MTLHVYLVFFFLLFIYLTQKAKSSSNLKFQQKKKTIYMDQNMPNLPLHSLKSSSLTVFNRVFAAIYATGILALLYYHGLKLLHSTTKSSLFISISMLISDLLLAFMWLTQQAFRMNPVTRQVFPENVEKIAERRDFPALDIFICTADPYKEPPMSVVNTALSVMAYDYPTEKLSVYVSDDGGSQLTLFAFMEASKFGRYWLPFCRENLILERCPEVYFTSKCQLNYETQKIKMMYENMKKTVQDVVESGKVTEYINTIQEHEAFAPWTKDFTSKEHPSVIQILLESDKDRDIRGVAMPNLVYVSREKSKTSFHHFKAGALNTLIRVSAIMTNAPIIVTIDCDTISNDPKTPQLVLCYFMDISIRSKLAYIQFPQNFHGLNKDDIYSSEMKHWFHLNPRGMDGFSGPDYMGTGGFFMRRALFGSPSSLLLPKMAILSPDHVVENPILTSQHNIEMALHVSSCNYENQTSWGSKIGFRYGSLVEDFYTGYRLHSEGWKSVFCDPQRSAFFGEAPISLHEAVNQVKRWTIGLLEVAFSKYSTLTFGMRNLGPITALCYSHYAFSPLTSLPITIYTFLPQLTLLNQIYIFPKVSSPWFFLYSFLFLGSYGQDCLGFILAKSTITRWWNEQRMWLIRGLTSYLFGTIDYLMKQLRFSTIEFNVTNKVVDDLQRKRYDEGTFEFGVSSPMFYPLAVAAIINFASFFGGFLQIMKGENLDNVFAQMFIVGFAMVNSFPIYEAMLLRNDKGGMPTKITIFAILLACGLYVATSFIFKL